MPSPIQYIRANPAIDELERGRQRHAQEMQQRQADDLDIAAQKGLVAIYGEKKPEPASSPADQATTYPAEPQSRLMPDTGERPPSTPMPKAPAMPMAQPQAQPQQTVSPYQSTVGQNTQMIRSLAGTPGAGATMMNLHASNVDARQAAAQAEIDARNQAADQIMELLKQGDQASIQYAKQVAVQNNIQVPAEVFDNAKARALLVGHFEHAKTVSDDPQQRASFIRNALMAAKQGQNIQQQVAAGLNNMGQPTRKPWQVETMQDGSAIIVFEDGTAKTLIDPETNSPIKLMNDSKQSAFERKVALYQQANPNATLMEALQFANQKTSMGLPEAKMRVFTALSKMEDGYGEPLYGSPEDLFRAVDETVKNFGYTLPDKAAGDNKRLKFDAQGNRLQ